MQHIINHFTAKIRGRTGQRAHRKIVDNVFATRDALDSSASAMAAEMVANNAAMQRLRDRNKDLYRSIHHAQTVAGRIAEFFLPR